MNANEGIPEQVVPEWQKVFAKPNPGQLDVYDEIFANGFLMPLQRKSETRQMIALARSINPKVVMEIGADKGGGFYHWVNGLSPVKAIALELRGVPYIETFRVAFPQVALLGIEASSYSDDTVLHVSMFLNGDSIDCLFIDGDKNGSHKDIAAYLPMMSKGGLIFIHDVTDDIGMRHTFLDMGKQYRTELIYDGSEGIAAQERGQRGAPITSAYEQWLRIWGPTSCGVGVIYV